MDSYVYILSNNKNEILYVGMTSNIKRRLYEHRNHLVEGFTDKYNITKVLYVEYSNNTLMLDVKLDLFFNLCVVEKSRLLFIDLYDDIMKS